MTKVSLLAVYMLTSKKLLILLIMSFYLKSKLNHYGISGTEPQWFKIYLEDGNSTLFKKNSYINYEVPRGSVLDLLLFLVYIKDLDKAIKYSDVHHLNLLLSDKLLNKINKYINHDLKLLNIWLRANKIPLNASKTEIILFRPKSQYPT